MSEQRILRGTTQTLVSYPRLNPQRLAQAQPTGTPRAFLRAPGGTDAAFGNVTADTLSTTVTASAAAGERELSIASATIVAGRLYLVAFGGDTVVVEARKGGSAQTTLYVAQPLPCDIPDDATVKGFAVSRALTTTETGEIGEGSITWEAVVDGVTLRWSQLFRVVERVPTMLLTYSELVRARPAILSHKPAQEMTWDEVIVAAWEHRIVPLLEAKGAFDEDVVSDNALVPLHALACFCHLVDDAQHIDSTFKADLRSRWEEMVSTTFARKSWSEAPQTEEAPPVREVGMEPNRGRMRLTR